MTWPTLVEPAATVAMWTPGPWEIVLVLAAMLLLFGKRLPEVGRSLGRGMVEFRKGLKGIEDEALDVEVVRDKERKSAGSESPRSLPPADANATKDAVSEPKKPEEVSRSA